MRSAAVPRRLVSSVAAVAIAASAVVLTAPSAHADAVRNSEWYLHSLGVEQAWSTTKGVGVRIGIIDTGVDGRIPDLRGAVVAGKDFSGAGSADGQKPVAGQAHGTNVAALAAGRGHGGGSGLIGVAPAAKIVTASIGLGSGSSSGFAEAIKWAVDQHVGVINLSFGAVSADAVQSGIEYAEAHDVVLVAATGDVAKAQLKPGYPAIFPGVVGVTGVDANLKLDPGATTGPGTAIAAPFSTAPSDRTTGATSKGLTVANPSNSAFGPYQSNQVGTSFAAPIVAGVVALIRAAHPDLDAANVVNRLLKSATPAGGPVPNDSYGYGVVNADRAVHANIPPVSANPLGTLVPGGGHSSSSAPSSRATTSAPVAGDSTPAGPTSSAPAVASSSGSSGFGTGAWVAIGAAVLLAVVLVGWLISRNNRRSGAPPGYGPPR